MTRASVLPSQADIERATKAAVRGFQAATGRTATGVKITFSQGVPSVEVTASVESPPAPAEQNGGDNVQALKTRLRGCHERRP